MFNVHFPERTTSTCFILEHVYPPPIVQVHLGIGVEQWWTRPFSYRPQLPMLFVATNALPMFFRRYPVEGQVLFPMRVTKKGSAFPRDRVRASTSIRPYGENVVFVGWWSKHKSDISTGAKRYTFVIVFLICFLYVIFLNFIMNLFCVNQP